MEIALCILSALAVYFLCKYMFVFVRKLKLMYSERYSDSPEPFFDSDSNHGKMFM